MQKQAKASPHTITTTAHAGGNNHAMRAITAPKHVAFVLSFFEAQSMPKEGNNNNPDT
jgi:hypothetical protein